jgi:hypothetical protein
MNRGSNFHFTFYWGFGFGFWREGWITEYVEVIDYNFLLPAILIKLQISYETN